VTADRNGAAPDVREAVALAFEDFAAALTDSAMAALNARRMDAGATLGAVARQAATTARTIRDGMEGS
jgi:hypothetical protein